MNRVPLLWPDREGGVLFLQGRPDLTLGWRPDAPLGKQRSDRAGPAVRQRDTVDSASIGGAVIASSHKLARGHRPNDNAGPSRLGVTAAVALFKPKQDLQSVRETRSNATLSQCLQLATQAVADQGTSHLSSWMASAISQTCLFPIGAACTFRVNMPLCRFSSGFLSEASRKPRTPSHPAPHEIAKPLGIPGHIPRARAGGPPPYQTRGALKDRRADSDMALT